MNFKGKTGHLSISVIVGVVTPIIAHMYGVNMTPSEAIIITFFMILGANFPDDDTDSIPSRIHAIVGSILSVYLIYIKQPGYMWIIWVPYIAAKMFGHRKWTHSKLLPIWIIFLPWILEVIIFLTIHFYKPNLFLQLIVDFIVKYRLETIAFSMGIYIHIFLDWKFFKKVRG